MDIRQIRTLRGPNYWSNYRRQLIQITLDIGEYEQLPTNKINGFADRLESAMPSLSAHGCSEKKPGGFFSRVREGTWMGHVVEHIALELQTLAGMDCGYGRTRSAGERGVYFVVFSYELSEAGIYAGEMAVDIVQQLAEGRVPDINGSVAQLSAIRSDSCLGPSTAAIYEEARQRSIPVRRITNGSELQLGYGCNSRRICAAMTGSTSAMASELASDKQLTRERLHAGRIPVPSGTSIHNKEDLRTAIEQTGFPVVIKPLDGNHGRGVTTGIRNYETALDAYKKAARISDEVIVEKFIPGADYRLLVVNYKMVAAAKRLPPVITGNGHSSVIELISIINSDPRRGNGHENLLSKIETDDALRARLASRGYHLDEVLPAGQQLVLCDTANLSTGGTAEDVTDTVHPVNRAMAERAARIIGLDICGIDLVTGDLAAARSHYRVCYH